MPIPVAVSADEEDRAADARSRRLHPVGELREERIEQLGGDESDGVAAPTDQTPGHQVGSVSELGDGVEDAIASLCRATAFVVDDAGDGAGGNADVAGDVIERHRAAGSGGG